MSKYIEPFQQAIRERRKVKIIMKRASKDTPLLATCAPLDFAPRRNDPNGEPLFHVWKYGYKGNKSHQMSITQEALTRLELIDETFDPAALVTWDKTEKPWTFPRDWGALS